MKKSILIGITTNMNFFKCKSNDYSLYKKGYIYHKKFIEKFLIEYPEDWQPILDYPTSTELLNCIESGKNKSKIIKALKQWKNIK